MDPRTRKARELVDVVLRDGDGAWYWDGLTWNGDQAKSAPMERGRAEILVAQTRRRIAEGMTRAPSDRCEIVELATPELTRMNDPKAVAADLRRILGAR